jgi:hypothetical protein
MRFRLRTLMIFLAIGPPLLAVAWLTAQKFRESPEVVIWPGPITGHFEIGCRFNASSGEEPAEASD